MSAGPSGPRTPERADPEADERPPVLGGWRALYAVVIAVLVLEILLFGWISRLDS